MQTVLADDEFRRRLDEVLQRSRRMRKVVDSDLFCDVSVGERRSIDEAVRISTLRWANLRANTPESTRTYAELLTVLFYGLVAIFAVGVAFLAFRESAPPAGVALNAWAGAAWAFAVREAFDVVAAGWAERRAAWVRSLQWYFKRPVRFTLYSCFAAAAVIAPVLVLLRVSESRGIGRAFWYCCVALLIGAMSVGLRTRVQRAVTALVLPRAVASSRYRPVDEVVYALACCATVAERARRARGDEHWSVIRGARTVIDELASRAADIDQMARASCRSPWRYHSVRVATAAPYYAVAGALRSHVKAVATAISESDWNIICQSLASGAIAAADNDWPALLEHLPPRSRTRRLALVRGLRGVVPSLALALAAVVLPIWISFGSYAASVRAVLIVSAIFGLLPQADSASDTVTGTLFKTMPFRGST